MSYIRLTLQEFVQLLGACRDLDNLSSPLMELSSCGKAHWHQFGSFSLREKVNESNSVLFIQGLIKTTVALRHFILESKDPTTFR